MEPFPAQRKFIRNALSPENHISVALGAIRSTKSAAFALCIIYHCEEFGDGMGLLAGRSAQTVEGNVIRPYLEPMARERGVPYTFNRSKWEISLAGVHLDVKGALNEKSQDLIQGRTYHLAALDEIALMPESFVDQARGRLSVKGARLIATMNPTATRHWIKRKFLDAIPMYKQHFMLADNLALDEETILRYYASFSGAARKRMILGEFADSAGLVYQRYEVVSGELPEFDMIICGCDSASSSVTAAVWMGRIKGTLDWMIFDEYYVDGLYNPMSSADHARHIVDRKWEVDAYVPDPSAASLAIDLSKITDRSIYPGYNKVDEGIQITDMALSSSVLKIHSNCTNTLDEISYYAWDEKATEQGEDKPVKSGDHAMDAMRYGVMAVMPGLMNEFE